LVNYHRKVVLHSFNFKKKVKDLKFSPNGRLLAVTHDKHIQLWKTPGFTREFAPFVLENTLLGHHDSITSVAWSSDSQWIVSASKDNTVRVCDVGGKVKFCLSGHRNTVISAFFHNDTTVKTF
jgi:periodic tryptophan protein 2